MESGQTPSEPLWPHAHLFFSQTSILNKHLQELMDGLTAKVFRTYNASITLQAQLKELTSGWSPRRPQTSTRWNRSPAFAHGLCLVRSSSQRTKTSPPRSCPTTGPTGLWPSCATTRGLHPRLLRSPCRTCRQRSEPPHPHPVNCRCSLGVLADRPSHSLSPSLPPD